jgi:DnaJ-class molecular chaperone
LRPKKWWEVLMLPRDAPLSAIEASYIELRSRYHPDKSAEHRDGVKFHEVRMAYDAAIQERK